MHLDPLFLSRLQWAWVIGWHILLPAFTVGLASFIAVLEGLYFFQRDEIWLRISRFWIRIFALIFGIGVAIPSVVFYRHFRNKVDTMIVDMESQAIKLIEIIHGERRA